MSWILRIAKRPEREAHHTASFIRLYRNYEETAVAQWLRCCATNRKVAGSIPDGVIGIFH
jgi:hypothetical protein